jgi:DNA-binding Xre family transcriptional regulator
MKIKIREMALTRKGWSLYKLAEELGINKPTVYGWQKGHAQPNTRNMDKLCSVLDCTMDDLFEAEPVEVRACTQIN